MAKGDGIIKITGFIGGLSFYTRKGKNFVKGSSGHTKERMITDPAFKNVRKVNNEFGGASKASKAVRDGMGEVLNLISDKCNNRLTSLFHKVIAATEGERGRRPVRFTRKKLMIEGFQFKEKGATSLKMIAYGWCFFTNLLSLRCAHDSEL